MAVRMVLEVRGIFIWILFCTLCWFLTVVTDAVETEMLLARVERHSKGSTAAMSAQLRIGSHATEQGRSKE